MTQTKITLKTLAQATAQQVFDQSVNHLRGQKVKSVDSNGQCMYRSAAGLQCAAGCFIADEEYNPHFENQPWSKLVGYKGKDYSIPETHWELIRKLQRIHDGCVESMWEYEFKLLTEKFHLTYTPPSQSSPQS